MKPSDLCCGGFPPFVATFKRTEVECLMALLWVFLRDEGDAFRTIFVTDLNPYLRKELDSKKGLAHEILTNPFAHALESVDAAIELGFLAWSGSQEMIEARKAGLVFTNKALNLLKEKWSYNQKAKD